MKKRMILMLICCFLCLSSIPQVVYADDENTISTVKTIVDFEKLDEMESTFIINKADKPDLNSLLSAFPTHLTAYLEDGSEVLVDVTWVCEDEDYETSDSYIFIFNPLWDTTAYVLSDALDYYADVPYIPVYFTEDAVMTLTEDGTTGVKRTAAENMQIIYEFLTNEMELNTAAACGVLANIQKESNFNPNAEGDKDKVTGIPSSYGICQWHDSKEGEGRWTSLKTFCEENGYDWTTLEGQLYYLQYELSANNHKVLYNGKTIYNYLKSVSNLPEGAYDAAYYWCYEFERPANREVASQKRGALAQTEYWPKYRADVVSTLNFTDVPTSEWYYGYVEYAFQNSLMNGMTNTTFEPSGLLTREMFAVILHRLEGAPRAEFENKFADIQLEQWYTNGVLWANSQGIVRGYAEDCFGFGDHITREQMATMMYRYAQMKGYDVSKIAEFSNYTDADTVSEYAADAMKWAVGSGIINGKTETTLQPAGNATRAECATIMTRFMRLYNSAK